MIAWLLLGTTLAVRLLLWRKDRRGWALDIGTVPVWLFYYGSHGDWPLLAIPLLFGALDLVALRSWR